MQCLPGIFAIRLGPGYTYRLYTNKLFETANILSPVQNHVIENKYSYPIVRENYGVNVRKWYDFDVIHCDWTYTGIEFSVRNTITGERFRAPLVFFVVNMPSLLPLDSETLENTGGETIQISGASTYMPAMLYSYDPFNTHTPSQHASVVARVSTAAMYPAHVKRLIIEDAIRKKESCAISYDEITQENASVTSCGHVFTTEAITRWLSQPSSARCCPMCKQVCQLS
jgi:hypothetical protein